MNAPISPLSSAVLAETAAARVTLVHPVARFSLRARGDLAPLEAVFGLSLPGKIGRRAAAGQVEVLCLGPDEWVLQAPNAMAGGIILSSENVYTQLPHSLVEVSGREVTYALDGPRAAELLTIGCARDIDTIPVGEGRRTVFDGVTVVLWRDGENAFRLDIWNSFASHALDLLVTGCRELAADAVRAGHPDLVATAPDKAAGPTSSKLAIPS